MPASLPVYIHTINIGNWKLVGFSRETTTGYSFGVKNCGPINLFQLQVIPMMFQVTCQHICIWSKNYEGLDSFFWYGMPNVFPMNVDEIILNRIKSLDIDINIVFFCRILIIVQIN